MYYNMISFTKLNKCMSVCFVFPDVNQPSLMIHIWVGGFPKSQPGMGCNQQSLGCCFFPNPISRPKTRTTGGFNLSEKY